MRISLSLVCSIVLISWVESACAADAPIDYAARPAALEASLADASALDANRPPTPPAEAYSACEGHSEGDACTVKFRDQTLDGTCRKFPDNAAALVCVPTHMPPPPRQ
jgi:hypothetical protein